MGSRGPSVTDPAPKPEIVNWAGTPAIMVRRYAARPRRPRPWQLEPEPWVQSRPEPKSGSEPKPLSEPKAEPTSQPASRVRLRDLDPLPDERIWLVDDVLTPLPLPTQRQGGLRRALASAVGLMVVLDAGALLIRSAGAKGNSPASTALRAFSPASPAPPMSEPAPTSSTTTGSTTTVARKLAVSRPVIRTRTTSRASTAGGSTTAQLPTSGTWACIIQHESGGNPRAVNPVSGAGGLFQFLPSSWILYGGTGRPQDATVQEQWRVAQNAYARSGFSPWRGDGCV